MADSLLAYLFPRIKGSTEDVATMSLNYILSQSEILRNSFTKLLSEKLRIDYEPLNYLTQVVGDQKERPDIVGFSNGEERIIIEAKFFAALTENQPGTYLDRLNGQGGLVFLCPESRKIGLWNHLLDLQPYREIDTFCVDINGAHMTIISWDALFNILQADADNVAPEAKENLHQLIGFCKEIENTSFLPFKPEDFGADVAKGIDRYYLLVDAVAENLLHRMNITATKGGLHAASQWAGYTQYLTIEGIGVGIYFHREIWKKSSPPSPFGLTTFNDHGLLYKYISIVDSRKVVTDSKGNPFILLTPPVGKTLDESADMMADQIINHINKMIEIRDKE